WNVRPVSNSSVQPGPSQSDPAIAVDANGRVYFAMAANDSSAVVSYSDDHGNTWNNIVSLSSALGLQNIRYPTATAGDAGRAATATGNAYSATATIARQSSGKRLLAASDAVSKTRTAPGMPFVTQRRIGNVVHLAWSEADSGSSAVKTYQILRGTASGAETLLATVNAPQTRYDDLSATDTTKTYYYKVVAANRIGSSAPNNEISAPFVG